MRLFRSACWAVDIKSVWGRKGRTQQTVLGACIGKPIWRLPQVTGGYFIPQAGVSRVVPLQFAHEWRGDPILCSGMGMPGQAGHVGE